MIFAPVIRRATYVAPTPRALDGALQRFMATPLTPAAWAAGGCTVQQDANATTVSVDVPGLTRDQIDVRIEGSSVTLRSVEGAPRTLQCTFDLGHEIDATASRARLEHGVLTLTLAQRAPEPRGTALAVE
ncbi:MAG: Hsp20/alpha crystallin family protein [Burkholderiaceae bacterium]